MATAAGVDANAKAANAASIAPAIEELTYRGLGISLVEPWGVGLAVLVTGILFGAAHGLVLGFPILAFFGIVVGALRAKTGSVYPGMLLHATFNAIAPPVTGVCGGVMQIPGPTLIVVEGQTVTVNLKNGLPTAAGNTSILFPGFNVTSTGGVAGLLTQEAAPGSSVSYTFTAGSPGTRAYYSGTQGDLQVEMGLYGAIIVIPSTIPGAEMEPVTATEPPVATSSFESTVSKCKGKAE